MKTLIAIPAYNEEKGIRHTITELVGFLGFEMPDDEVEIVIVDNASQDDTSVECEELVQKFANVSYKKIGTQGKGLAIRTAWHEAEADAYVFMDADLSTDLSALPRLLEKLKEEGGVVAGSRFHPDSRVDRSLGRKVVSHAYRAWVSTVFGGDVADLPCGFKAITKDVLRDVLPAVKDNKWFFDSELVIRARAMGFPVTEVPVIWRDTREGGSVSKVSVPRVASEYVVKTLQLRKEIKRL